MNIRTFARRYPVGCYLGLTFAISWIGSLLGGGTSFLRGESPELEQIWPMVVPMLLAPSLSGILMTWLVEGRRGLRDLFGRMTIWHGRWSAPLLIFPVSILVVSLLLSALVSPQFTPTFFAYGILIGLFAGLLEETGWMGFAFPRMRSTYGLLGAALGLGLVHGVWHVVADFLGNIVTMGGYWLPYFTGFFLCMVALRVLIVWVYANTGSLLLTQLMHASSTGFLAVLVPMDLTPQAQAVFYLAYAVALAAVAAFVVVRYGRELGVRASATEGGVPQGA